jgi:drug/metabolite transporter (DMT)-like permease
MRKGVLLMMAAALALTVMIGFAKVARAELSTMEVMFWRGLISVPLALGIALRGGGIGLHNRRVFALRAALGTAAMFCFFTATKQLALADLSLLYKLQPILVALVAPLVLGDTERSDWRLWLVLAAGVTGCAILLAPQAAVDLTPGLWALGATVFSAGAHICVRLLGKTDRPAALVMWFQLVMTLCALVVTLISNGGALPRAPIHLWPVLLGCGVCATVGQLLMTTAYRIERAPTVAAAAYVGPLWALIGDVVFFELVPGLNALAGGAIIVGAGLWLMRSRPPRGELQIPANGT